MKRTMNGRMSATLPGVGVHVYSFTAFELSIGDMRESCFEAHIADVKKIVGNSLTDVPLKVTVHVAELSTLHMTSSWKFLLEVLFVVKVV